MAVSKVDKSAILKTIRDKIQFLSMKPGDKISENLLADELNVSRTPIREALILLTDEQLVEIFPQSGTYIAHINLSLVKELVYMRHVLEKDILLKLCKKKAKVQQAIEKSMMMQELAIKNSNVREYIFYDDEFHEKLFEFAGYPEIWRIISMTRSHHTRFRVLDLQLPAGIPSSHEEHKSIIKCIEDGNDDELKYILEIHHDTELVNKDQIIAEHPEYFV